MNAEKKDLVIPHELLSSFEGNIRVFHQPIPGIWPIDPILLKKVLDHYPELAKSQRIKDHYKIALIYKGKNIKKDIVQSGLKLEEPRIVKDYLIHGIPVPVDLNPNLRNFEMIFARYSE